MIRNASVFVALTLFTGCGLFSDRSRSIDAIRPDYDGIYYVSMVQLLATPYDFDAKKVRVIGFYDSSSFEDSSLYLTIDDMKVRNRESSLAIGAFADNRIEKYSNHVARLQKQVVVVGTFSAGPEGHGGMWPGAIRELTGLNIIQK